MSRIVIFEDPENRKVLRVSDEVGVNEEFCLGKDCWDCSVFDKAEEGGIETCTRWVLENPHEAGKLMGYRVLAVQENEGEEEKKKDNSEENVDEAQNKFKNESQKPFLLQYLDVEPEQPFEIEGDEGDYLVNDRGQLMMENQALLGGWILASLMTVYRVLDNPGLVQKKTKVGLNEEEVKTLRMVRDLVPGVKTMGLNRETDEIVFWDENGVVELKMPRQGRFLVLDKVPEVDVDLALS